MEEAGLLQLMHHFGVGVLATTAHLNNLLQVITDDERQALLQAVPPAVD